jgi:hypothetical protein
MSKTLRPSLRSRQGLAFAVTLLAGLAPTLAGSAEPPVLTVGKIPSTLGVNLSWHYYPPVETLEAHIPSQIAKLQELGVRWARLDMRWEDIETVSGVYDFRVTDLAVGPLNDAGIKVLLLLTCKNPCYASGYVPSTPEQRQAFVNFVAAAVQRYVDKDVAWEICNEPNRGPNIWAPDSEQLTNYKLTAEAATAEIRRIAPSHPVMGPAISGPNKAMPSGCWFADQDYFFAGVRDATGVIVTPGVLDSPVTDSWSAVSVHPYRRETTPEMVLPEMDALQCQIDASRPSLPGEPRLPAVISEHGYTTYDGLDGVNDQEQAAYTVRFFLTAISKSIPIAIWYAWQDTGTDPINPEKHYGLVCHGAEDGTAYWDDPNFCKPSYHAAKRMIEKLTGAQFESAVDVGPNAMALKFYRKSLFFQREPVVAWSTDDIGRWIALPLPPGSWTETDLVTGEVMTIEVPAGGVATSVFVDAHPNLYEKTNLSVRMNRYPKN